MSLANRVTSSILVGVALCATSAPAWALIGGVPALGEDVPDAAVATLIIGFKESDGSEGAAECHGTWIGGGLFLTAAHCMCRARVWAGDNGGPDKSHPTSIQVLFRNDTLEGGVGTVTRWVAHPGYQLQGVFCNDPAIEDIAPGLIARHDLAVLGVQLQVGESTTAKRPNDKWMRFSGPPTTADDAVAFQHITDPILIFGAAGLGGIAKKPMTAAVGGQVVLSGLYGEDDGIREGDSGAPMVVDFPTSKLILGVASQHDFGTTWWTPAYNLTYPGVVLRNRDFIEQALAVGVGNVGAFDVDGDGIYDPVDNCAGKWNSQADKDGDGVGDACDLCPCDPNEVDPNHDGDGDGLCALECVHYTDGTTLVSKGDSCPQVKQGYEFNCNGKLESRMKGDDPSGIIDQYIVGDSCDPVPCAAVELEYKDVELSRTTEFFGSLTVTTVTSGRSLIGFDAALRGSWPANGDVSNEVPVSVPATNYRYCVSLPGIDVDCTAFAKSEPYYTDPKYLQNLSNPVEGATSVFHRVRVSTKVVGGSIGSNDGALVYKSGASIHRLLAITSDHEDWVGSPWGEEAQIGTTAAALARRGLFWTHSDTTAGLVDVGSGARPAPHPSPAKEVPSGYASHHVEVQPYEVLTKRNGSYPRYQRQKPYFVRNCLACDSAFTLPDAPREDCPQCLKQIPGVDKRWSYPVLQLPSGAGFAGSIATLADDGSYALVDSGRVGPGLSAAMANRDRTWVSAAEYSGALGSGSARPSALQLSADGRVVTSSAFVSGGILGDARDLFVGDVAPGARAARTSAAVPAASDTAPAADFIATYSRAVGEMYVLRGPNARLMSIYDVDSDRWIDAALSGVQLGTVQALSWAPRDGALWIIDEAVERGKKVARLLRVDRSTRVVDVLGKWRRLGQYHQHWLVPDRDGEMLVVASTVGKRGKHTVMKAALRRGTVHLRTQFSASGSLEWEPLVDERGYTFFQRVDERVIPRQTVKLEKPKRAGDHGHGGHDDDDDDAESCW